MRLWGWYGIVVAVSALMFGDGWFVSRELTGSTDLEYEPTRPERYAPLLHIPHASWQPDIIIIDHFCRYPLRQGRCPKR